MPHHHNRNRCARNPANRAPFAPDSVPPLLPGCQHLTTNHQYQAYHTPQAPAGLACVLGCWRTGLLTIRTPCCHQHNTASRQRQQLPHSGTSSMAYHYTMNAYLTRRVGPIAVVVVKVGVACDVVHAANVVITRGVAAHIPLTQHPTLCEVGVTSSLGVSSAQACTGIERNRPMQQQPCCCTCSSAHPLGCLCDM